MAEGVEGEVAGAAVLLGDAVEGAGQDVGFAGQGGAQDEVLGFGGDGEEGDAPALAADARVEIVEGALGGGVDEESGGEARELVADGAVDGPVVG
jgi:hypothetical protein